MLFLDNMSNSRFLFESKVWCLAIIHCYKNSRWDWLKATGAWKLKEDRHQLSYSGTETLMNEHQKPYWLKLSPMDYQRPEAISEHPYGKTSLIALGWMIWSGGLHVHIRLFFSLFLFLFLTFHWHIRADLKKPIERERRGTLLWITRAKWVFLFTKVILGSGKANAIYHIPSNGSSWTAKNITCITFHN